MKVTLQNTFEMADSLVYHVTSRGLAKAISEQTEAPKKGGLENHYCTLIVTNLDT